MARSDGSDLDPDKYQRILSLQSALRAATSLTLPRGTLLFKCERCESIYPLTHFSRNSQRRYGIRPICRHCRRQDRPVRDYAPAAMEEKHCKGCHTKHPIAAFYGDRSQPDGYSQMCREAANRRRQARIDARDYDTVLAYRYEQSIRLCGEHGIPYPGYNIKQCKRCKRVLPINDFNGDDTRSDRRHSLCAACHSQAN